MPSPFKLTTPVFEVKYISSIRSGPHQTPGTGDFDDADEGDVHCDSLKRKTVAQCDNVAYRAEDADADGDCDADDITLSRSTFGPPFSLCSTTVSDSIQVLLDSHMLGESHSSSNNPLSALEDEHTHQGGPLFTAVAAMGSNRHIQNNYNINNNNNISNNNRNNANNTNSCSLGILPRHFEENDSLPTVNECSRTIARRHTIDSCGLPRNDSPLGNYLACSCSYSVNPPAADAEGEEEVHPTATKPHASSLPYTRRAMRECVESDGEADTDTDADATVCEVPLLCPVRVAGVQMPHQHRIPATGRVWWGDRGSDPLSYPTSTSTTSSKTDGECSSSSSMSDSDDDDEDDSCADPLLARILSSKRSISPHFGALKHFRLAFTSSRRSSGSGSSSSRREISDAKSLSGSSAYHHDPSAFTVIRNAPVVQRRVTVPQLSLSLSGAENKNSSNADTINLNVSGIGIGDGLFASTSFCGDEGSPLSL